MPLDPSTDPSARSLLDPEDAQLIDAFVEERREAARLPGVAVVILEGGTPVHLRGYGFSDLEARSAMTTESLLPIGSNTFGMTALAVLQQVSAGTLELDAPVSATLPWFERSGSASFTIRHLLTHTAGLPAARMLAREADEAHSERSLEKHVKGLAEGLTTGAEPAFEISHDGYAVAGLLVERATGTPYEVAMQDHLFAPLGMQDTRFTAAEPVPGQAGAYVRENSTTTPVALPHSHTTAPAIGVLASTRDIGRYLAALLTRRMPGVSEALMREAWSAQASIRDGVDYGFGWFLTRSGDLQVVAHPGEAVGGGSSFLLLPRLGTAVAVLTNMNSAAKEEIARGIAAILLGDEPAPSQLRPERPRSEFEPDRTVWQEYAGAFEAPTGTLHVSIDGDVLRGNLLGQSFELEPFSDTEFVARSAVPALDSAAVAFRRESDGRLTLLVQGRPFASR